MSKQIPKIEASDEFHFMTSIWIVPFIALLIAAWLAYQYFSELGPQIRIVFPKNEGLQAGQSHIKYRNVPVGTVTKIELQEDGTGIVVVARMEKTVTPFLNESSKFWIVKPEVGIGGVSGLDTLISGTYIDMHAKKDENIRANFVGQEHAYRNDSTGEYFVLNTHKGESAIKVGTPIYLKNIKVGQVEYVVLSLDNASVDVIVFIQNEYTPYLRTDSSFWVRTTFDVSFNNGHLDLAVAPVTDLIQGAIEFSSHKKGLSCNVPDGYVFKLYSNKGEVENTYLGKDKQQLEPFKIQTKESMAKLHIGSSVRYEGFEVGKVTEINTHYNKETHAMLTDVIVSINMAIFSNVNDVMSMTGKENFMQAIRDGLEAKIVPSDPITGFLYVDLIFGDEENQTILYDRGYNVLPSAADTSGNMMASMTKILDKINAIPLDTLVASLQKMIANANTLVLDSGKVVKDVNAPLVTVLEELQTTVKNLNKFSSKKTFVAMPDTMDKTLKELTKTLKTTKKVVGGYSNNSLIARQLSDTLKMVTKTSKEMSLFLKMLNRKPNSLIFGDK